MCRTEPLPDYAATVAELGDPTDISVALAAELRATELPQFAECPLVVRGARGDE